MVLVCTIICIPSSKIYIIILFVFFTHIMPVHGKRARGRPPKPHKRVNFKLSTELEAWLNETSERFGTTKTALVEEALHLLKKKRKNEPPPA